MLVLTRKLQEQIAIGQDITITILKVKGNTVRIGIEAPAAVRVVRGELPRHDTPRTVPSNATPAKERSTNTEVAASQPLHKPIRQQAALGVQTRTTGKSKGLRPIIERAKERRQAVNAALLSAVAATDTIVANDASPSYVLASAVIADTGLVNTGLVD